MKLSRKRTAPEEITGTDLAERIIERRGVKERPILVGLGRVMLTGDPAADSLKLREEFHIQLIELADMFDRLDHIHGPAEGTELQDDCLAIRELTRKEMHPRFQEAFCERQAEILDAEILAGLVAGPNA